MQETQETWVRSLDGEVPLEEEMQSTLAFLPGESHGQRNLAGHSPWVCSQTWLSNWEVTHKEKERSFIEYLLSVRYSLMLHYSMQCIQNSCEIDLIILIQWVRKILNSISKVSNSAVSDSKGQMYTIRFLWSRLIFRNIWSEGLPWFSG